MKAQTIENRVAHQPFHKPIEQIRQFIDSLIAIQEVHKGRKTETIRHAFHRRNA